MAAAPSGPAPCSDQDLVIAVRVDKPRYQGAQLPTFTWLVDNIGPTACTRDLAPALRELVVNNASGARVWSDRDCSRPPETLVQTLQPNVPVASRLVWAGRSSSPSCTGPRAPVGPGEYHVVARLGPITSGPVPFTLVK
jgi:hypothetical protein